MDRYINTWHTLLLCSFNLRYRILCCCCLIHDTLGWAYTLHFDNLFVHGTAKSFSTTWRQNNPIVSLSEPSFQTYCKPFWHFDSIDQSLSFVKNRLLNFFRVDSQFKWCIVRWSATLSHNHKYQSTPLPFSFNSTTIRHRFNTAGGSQTVGCEVIEKRRVYCDLSTSAILRSILSRFSWSVRKTYRILSKLHGRSQENDATVEFFVCPYLEVNNWRNLWQYCCEVFSWAT